jgi:hypothetical protein
MGNLQRGIGIAALLAACAPDVAPGGPADAAPRPDAEPRIPMGDHHPYVMDSITLPTNGAEAEQLGLDVDGDGQVDNQLGSIVALLSTNGADMNVVLAGQIDRGETIQLADLQTTDLADATNSALYIWKGENPLPLPCTDIGDTVCRHHLAGNGTFDVAPVENPGQAMIFGGISGMHYGGNRGVVQLEVPLFVADQALHLEVIGARAEVEVSELGMTMGHLAGAVTEDYIESDVLPELHNVLAIVVERDCGGTSPNCCDADTDGAQTVGLFDADSDCMVSLAELQDSGLLDALLAPDVDLLDEEGLEGSDGVKESVSLGVGFTAVTAVYDPPAGL